jgi:integrase
VQRKREYLTETELEKLMKAAGTRDRAMILLAYRHGFRVSELCSLEWRQVIDLDREARASLQVTRRKNGKPGTHPLEPDEVKALRKLRGEQGGSPGRLPDTVYVFQARDGGKLTEYGFRKQLTRLADKAGLAEQHVHPHMLRHTCGQMLVERMPLGMLADYMGHVKLDNTRRYSETNGERFRGIWRRPK